MPLSGAPHDSRHSHHSPPGLSSHHARRQTRRTAQSPRQAHTVDLPGQRRERRGTVPVERSKRRAAPGNPAPSHRTVLQHTRTRSHVKRNHRGWTVSCTHQTGHTVEPAHIQSRIASRPQSSLTPTRSVSSAGASSVQEARARNRAHACDSVLGFLCESSVILSVAGVHIPQLPIRLPVLARWRAVHEAVAAHRRHSTR